MFCDNEPHNTITAPQYLSLSSTAFIGLASPKALRITAYILGHPVTVLNDSGSIHNIIKPHIASFLKLPITPIPSFPVMVDFSVPKISFQPNGSTINVIGEPLSTPASPSTIQHLMQKEAIASMHTLIFQYENSPQIQTPTPREDPHIQNILTDYSHIFEPPTSPPPPRLHDYHIPLKPNTPPVKVIPYRFPHYPKQIMTDLIADMLKVDLIKPSHSPYYRHLFYQFPIPTVDELLDELHGARIFSKIELRAGCHQIRLANEDTHKTAFRVVDGHFEFLVMPFGLSNTPSTFQAAMNDIFVMYYEEVHYLGHVISKDGVATYLRRLRQFMIGPNLLRSKFKWNDKAQEAFDFLKKAMSTLPVLALPDFSLTFDVTTDASGTGIGAVLSQQDKPIAFFSKKLSPRMHSSSTYIWELFAITDPVKKWCHYLLARKFRVFTDQRSLKHLLTQVIQSPEQYKWASKLLGYDFEVHYKPGKENHVADAQSRIEESQLLSLSTLLFPWLQELREYYTNTQKGRDFISRVAKQAGALPGRHIRDGAIEMTLFQALFGCPPPALPHYMLGSSKVVSIDDTLAKHERVIVQNLLRREKIPANSSSQDVNSWLCAEGVFGYSV
nr:hypothetical protein [Tanacetum cinerariifolium]